MNLLKKLLLVHIPKILPKRVVIKYWISLSMVHGFLTHSDYIKSDYNKTNNNTYNQRYMLSDDIYDKLFELASFKQPKKTTNNKVTNNKVTNNKITKKNNKQDGQNKKTRRVKM